MHLARAITGARDAIIFMSIVLRSTVQRFFSHTEEGSQTRNVCVFQKQLTLLDVLNRTTPHQLFRMC